MTTAGQSGIKVTDIPAVIDFIKAVNGKAVQHTIPPREVIDLARTAEKALEKKGIAVSRRTGCEYEFTSAAPKAKSYKYAAVCTTVRFRRFREGWRIMSAERIKRFPGGESIEQVFISPTLIDHIKAMAVAAVMKNVTPIKSEAKAAA